MRNRRAIRWRWNVPSSGTITTIFLSCRLGDTIRRSVTGTRHSITAPGCRLRLAGRTWSGLAGRLSPCTSLASWRKEIFHQEEQDSAIAPAWETDAARSSAALAMRAITITIARGWPTSIRGRSDSTDCKWESRCTATKSRYRS